MGGACEKCGSEVACEGCKGISTRTGEGVCDFTVVGGPIRPGVCRATNTIEVLGRRVAELERELAREKIAKGNAQQLAIMCNSTAAAAEKRAKDAETCVVRYRDRERDICAAIPGVSDGGKYRADIISHLQWLHAEAKKIPERYKQGQHDAKAIILNEIKLLVPVVWVTQLDGKSPESLARVEVLRVITEAIEKIPFTQ